MAFLGDVGKNIASSAAGEVAKETVKQTVKHVAKTPHRELHEEEEKAKLRAFWQEDDEEAFARIFPGYPEPQHIQSKTTDPEFDQQYNELDEEFGESSSAPASARNPAHKFNNVERLSEFMDRYIPHWREMTPIERRIELDDLADEMRFDYEFTREDERHGRGNDQYWEPVEIENSLDFEPIKKGFAPSNNTDFFHTIHYFPEGTAAWDESLTGLSPEQEELASVINSYIASMTSYGRREEQVVNRYPQILIWANDSASWYIPQMPTYHIVGWDGTDQRLKIGDYVSLDANEILVYGSKKMLEPILPWLDPLPLYGASYEAKQRGIYDFGTHLKAIDPNIDWDDKLAQWDENYPEPSRIFHSGDTELTKQQMRDTINSIQDLDKMGIDQHDASRRYLSGATGDKAHSTATDYEPLSDFLDRYIPDWRELSPEERWNEIENLPFNVDGFEVYEPEDAEFVTLHLQGYDQSFRGVRYYPTGTAAYEEPLSLRERDLPLSESKALEEISEQGFGHGISSPHYLAPGEDFKRNRWLEESEPLVDVLSRYIPEWESLSPEEIREELIGLGFHIEVFSPEQDDKYIPGYYGPGGAPTFMQHPDQWHIRYYPRGTAAFDEPEPREAMHGRLTGEPMLRELGYISDDDRAIITDRYPYRRSQTPGNSAYPEHAEPLSQVLNRYVPNWQDMDDEEITQEIENLRKEFIFDIEDSKGVWTGLNQAGHRQHWKEWAPVLEVRYYPAGTAAFADRGGLDPEVLANLIQEDTESIRDFIQELRNDLHKNQIVNNDRAIYDTISILEDELNKRQRGTANFESSASITLTGSHIRTFRLQTSRDGIAPIDFWRLDNSPANIALLVATADDWEVQATDLRDSHGNRTDQSRRAQFASDAAFVAAKLLGGDGCCVILGYNKNTNEVVGISVYHTWQDGSANISLVSTSPNNQPDSQSIEKVRGVGTAMVCLMAQIFKHENIKKICLKPLDEDAKIFWQHRGFTNYEGMLCIINDSEKLMRACLMPECPDTGEHCSIGEFELTEPVTKKSRRY